MAVERARLRERLLTLGAGHRLGREARRLHLAHLALNARRWPASPCSHTHSCCSASKRQTATSARHAATCASARGHEQRHELARHALAQLRREKRPAIAATARHRSTVDVQCEKKRIIEVCALLFGHIIASHVCNLCGDFVAG